MIVSEKLGVIFVHIPRTGGWSIAYQLSKMAENDQDYSPTSRPESSYYPGLFRHASAAQIKEAIDPELWARCFKFAFVRNPWDRLASIYAYKKKHHGVEASFADWLASYGGEGPYMDFEREARTQREFLYDTDGNLLVDYVGRFETLPADVDAIMERLRPSETLHRHLNQSVRRHYSRMYKEQQAVGLASKLCRTDAAQFGYQLETHGRVACFADEAHYQLHAMLKRLKRLRNR
jgi:hypothetical protein